MVASDRILNGFADQGGHGDAWLCRYQAQAHEQFLGKRDCGAVHAIMIAYAMQHHYGVDRFRQGDAVVVGRARPEVVTKRSKRLEDQITQARGGDDAATRSI